MELFYLTPASISYLNQFLQAVLITGYLFIRFSVQKKRQPSNLVKLMTGFFASISALSLLLLLENTLLPAERLLAVYLENTVLGITLVLLIDFAYHFPQLLPEYARERRIALALSMFYALSEAVFAGWRYSQLGSFQVEYRPDFADFLPAALILWLIFIFFRNAIQNRENRASRNFGFIFIIPFGVVIVNILRSFAYVSELAYHIFASIGILFAISFFVLNFLSSQPETTPFTTKFSALIFAVCLALFGSVAWIVAPVHAESYQPAIADHRTIHFSPNAEGGYTATKVPFAFDEDFGRNLNLTDSGILPVEKMDFEFPFFGQTYQSVYISNDGLIGIGAETVFRDYQLNFTSVPAILPLLVDLDPGIQPLSGVYARREANRLIITYDHISSFRHENEIYTFQVALFRNGEFSITYNGLPASYTYQPNQSPESDVWAIGIKPSNPASVKGSFETLPLEIGPQGLIQDEHRSFRQHQDRIMFPIALAVLASSFILILGVPLFIHRSLANPLNTLLAGVERMNSGKLDVALPIQFNDEIGYLTQSFNILSRELNGLIHELETRVSNRTSDLLAANEQLLKLSVVVEQSPSVIVITDIHANIEYVNPAFTQSTGYSLEEVMGKNPRILKSGLTPPEIYSEMWGLLMSGQAWRGELINKKKSGDVFLENTVITPIYDVNGIVTDYAAIKEDVTAQVLAERALRESEEQYRLLFDLETDAIFIIRNDDGQILQANKAAVALYGYTLGELLAKKNTELSAEPESTKKATNTKLPSDQVITIPLRYHRKKDGSVFPVEITARFITWENQSVHIAAMRDITERKKIEEELVKLSVTDPLTEIANRRYFYIQAEQIFNRTQAPNMLAILMLDIDHFKLINDRLGHAAGDSILRQLAERLNQNLRPTDILARYGGEEFVILLPRTPSYEAELIAKRLSQAMNEMPFHVGRDSVSVTISIGVAELTDDIENLDTLMHHADEAMYQAKQAGRNRWVVWKSEGA